MTPTSRPLPMLDLDGPAATINASIDVEALSHLDSGSLLIDLTCSIDGTVFTAVGESGQIEVKVTGGRLFGIVSTDNQSRILDAEDALGVDDSVLHSIGLTCDNTGTHLFLDGYESFSSTLVAWFSHIKLTEFRVDPDEIVDIRHLTIWDSPLSRKAILARSTSVTPFIQFSAAALSPRDAARCSNLRDGAIRARFRTRGSGQGGTIIAAHGNSGTLKLSIHNGDLEYSVVRDGQMIASSRACGQWDDGDWHDVAAVSGRGAIDLYADGYQVCHDPGTAFFEDIAPVDRVVVGSDLDGTRLFGEAQTAMVYNSVLSDHQVKRLAGVMPLETMALFDTGLNGSRSYRIPSIIRLESRVLIAGADQRVSIANDSPNDINFVIRRSLDDGKTWEPVQTVVTYPGSGSLGASVIDSVLVQDKKTGRVLVLIDHFPGGIGQPNCCVGTGFDQSGRRILTDEDDNEYVLNEDGSVETTDGAPTDFEVDKRGNVTKDGQPAGNIHLAHGVDPNESLLTVRTCYLQMVTSDDDGLTWSDPIDLNSQVKQDWMRFFGTSPGNAIQLSRGNHSGRILVPVYYNHEEGITFSCATIYSDDGGQTWHLGESPNDGRDLYGTTVHSRDLRDDRGSLHESVLVEGQDGAVHAFMRNQHPSGHVAHAVSADGGETWGPVEFVDQLTEIFSQPNAIAVDVDGVPGIVFANASQMLPFRGCGVLRLSYDDGNTWLHNRVLNPRHHVYQCMTQLPDGDLAVLWEREWQGLFLTRVPLSWLTASRSTIGSR